MERKTAKRWKKWRAYNRLRSLGGGGGGRSAEMTLEVGSTPMTASTSTIGPWGTLASLPPLLTTSLPGTLRDKSTHTYIYSVVSGTIIVRCVVVYWES